ncbi:molybdenum cofactor guanylyltransferase [Helicobacter sp. MIT 05-5294]|uniref:molybdenum cofactor guanylyltransferase n=1 Tax=Helicobacter sp. MIT 05-5294 TaxID=1548150 RepID=UPI001EE94756|nr:molybdenum cofactor guanylyltransferase [Helicobacter sp. MIT 05-5294]
MCELPKPSTIPFDAPPFAIPLVLLCGGKSVRMGKLKQTLSFGGESETLADFQIRRLKGAFESVYLSAKFAIPNAFGIQTILDSNAPEDLDTSTTLAHLPKSQFAPIFGLQSVLESLQCHAFVLSIDAPFFDMDCVAKIWQAYIANRKPTFAKNSKIHPLLGIYTRDSLAQIQAQIAQNDYKLMNLLSAINTQFVEIEEAKTQNLNTQEDYHQALAHIKS